MEVLEAIKNRRSIRKFTNEEIPHEILEKVLESAIYAPSWKNTQITRFTVIENGLEKEEIIRNCVPDFNKDAISGSPILIAVSVVKKRSGYERDGSFSTEKGDGWEMFDCGIATQTVCVTAYDHGLGTVIMGIFDEKKITEMIDLPEQQRLVALIALGYPAEAPIMPKRKEVTEIVRYIKR